MMSDRLIRNLGKSSKTLSSPSRLSLWGSNEHDLKEQSDTQIVVIPFPLDELSPQATEGVHFAAKRQKVQVAPPPEIHSLTRCAGLPQRGR